MCQSLRFYYYEHRPRYNNRLTRTRGFIEFLTGAERLLPWVQNKKIATHAPSGYLTSQRLYGHRDERVTFTIQQQ